jgi:hypothetical protein
MNKNQLDHNFGLIIGDILHFIIWVATKPFQLYYFLKDLQLPSTPKVETIQYK